MSWVGIACMAVGAAMIAVGQIRCSDDRDGMVVADGSAKVFVLGPADVVPKSDRAPMAAFMLARLFGKHGSWTFNGSHRDSMVGFKWRGNVYITWTTRPLLDYYKSRPDPNQT